MVINLHSRSSQQSQQGSGPSNRKCPPSCSPGTLSIRLHIDLSGCSREVNVAVCVCLEGVFDREAEEVEGDSTGESSIDINKSC